MRCVAMACVLAVTGTASADVAFTNGEIYGFSIGWAERIADSVPGDVWATSGYADVGYSSGIGGTSGGLEDPATSAAIAGATAEIDLSASNSSTSMVVTMTASGAAWFDDAAWLGYISSTVGTYGIEIEVGGVGDMSFTEVKLGGWATTRRLIQPVAGTGASINGNTLTAGCYTIDDLALAVISPETIAGSASVTASYVLTIER